MIEQMLKSGNTGGNPTVPPTAAGPADPDVVAGRTIRLQLLRSASSTGMIGTVEFYAYNQSGVNLNTQVSTKPTPKKVGTAEMWGYGSPANTINGVISPWQDSCYIGALADGQSCLQYVYPVDIWPLLRSMNIMFEGQYWPTAGNGNGLRILFCDTDGTWKRVTFVQSPGAWVGNTTNNNLTNLTLTAIPPLV